MHTYAGLTTEYWTRILVDRDYGLARRLGRDRISGSVESLGTLTELTQCMSVLSRLLCPHIYATWVTATCQRPRVIVVSYRLEIVIVDRGDGGGIVTQAHSPGDISRSSSNTSIITTMNMLTLPYIV